jgi:hypothetical protein
MSKRPPYPFTDAELHKVAPVIIKIQQACDTPALLVLEPAEVRLLRKLLLHLQARSDPNPLQAHANHHAHQLPIRRGLTSDKLSSGST